MAASPNAYADWLATHTDMLVNIAQSLIPVEKMVVGFAYLMGLGFFFKAFLTFKEHSESKSAMSSAKNFKEPYIYLFVGAMLLYFPSGLSMMLTTTFGTSSILQYQGIASSNKAISGLFGFDNAGAEALVTIIQVIGLIAFVRGWVLIARTASHGQQPGGIGKGLIHIFGGILAVNIVLTLQIVNNTLGTNIS